MKSLRQFWALVQFWLAVALRLRAGWIVVAVAVGLVGGGALVQQMHFGPAEGAFLIDYVAGVVAWGGSWFAALVGPALFFEGLRTRTTVVVLMHGARRGAMVAAQIVATGIALGWLLVLSAVAAIGLLQMLEHSALIGEGARALSHAAGPLLVLAAASVFFATLTRSALLATGWTLALALAGHLAPVIAQASERAGGLERALWTALSWMVPNFGVADGASTAGALGYFASYTLLYAGLAAWVFSHREL
jgi:hypothetical protein